MDDRKIETGEANSSRRRIWLRVSLTGLVLLLIWGIPEAVVRWRNPPLEDFRTIAFGGDPHSFDLFMQDWRLHWKLRPRVTTDFLGVPVRTDAHGFRGGEPGTGNRVVLCLGDSTTFGWKVEEADSYPNQLQARLNAAANSGKPWSVLNAGVPGYTSMQLRLLSEKLIHRWKPEVVIVCVGNNEAWPVARSDEQLDDDRAVARCLGPVLSKSRFFVWVAEKFRSKEPQPFIAPTLEDAVPRVSREEFGQNLLAIVQAARAAGARVILASPPVNLYWPPARFQLFPGWQEWESFLKRMVDLRNSGQNQKVFEEIDSQLSQHPDAFAALWVKGAVLSDLGREDEGRELLEQAIEHHPFPENCKRSYRQVISETARAEKTGFLDVNELFRRNAGASTPKTLYLDWCHPTPQGHALMAEALYRMMKEGGRE
ncbi:MAG: GDSL-type esterase/lipase family protein [Planctomycetota bacterium]